MVSWAANSRSNGHGSAGIRTRLEDVEELIQRSLKEARAVSGGIACGAGTEQLSASTATIEAVRSAYEEQCEFVEGLGGQVILMASRALAACACGPEDYRRIYGAILRQTARPVILHWLGEARPSLSGLLGLAQHSGGNGSLPCHYQ